MKENENVLESSNLRCNFRDVIVCLFLIQTELKGSHKLLTVGGRGVRRTLKEKL